MKLLIVFLLLTSCAVFPTKEVIQYNKLVRVWKQYGYIESTNYFGQFCINFCPSRDVFYATWNVRFVDGTKGNIDCEISSNEYEKIKRGELK